MYSRASASQMRLPSPRSMKGGTPPTARKARTGEFTPPGMTLRERSNSRSFFEVMSLEHRGELSRTLLDIRRVEHGADHRERVGSRSYQFSRIGRRDSPDRDDGAGQTS